MEDYWRLIWLLNQELTEDVEDDSEHNEGESACSNDHANGFIRHEIAQRLCEDCKEAHGRKRLTAILECGL